MTKKPTNENKSKQTRMSGDSLRLIRMYAGELQLNTGDNYSDAQAVYELFRTCRPDLVAKLSQISQNNEQ